MMPATTTRVQDNTDATINQRIQRQTEHNIAQFAGKGTDEITRRLEELDREWDIERLLEANAASVALLGLGLGTFVDRRFFIVPAIVAGFLLNMPSRDGVRRFQYFADPGGNRHCRYRQRRQSLSASPYAAAGPNSRRYDPT
jgi:hypothetical protein